MGALHKDSCYKLVNGYDISSADEAYALDRASEES